MGLTLSRGSGVIGRAPAPPAHNTGNYTQKQTSEFQVFTVNVWSFLPQLNSLNSKKFNKRFENILTKV